MAFTSGAHAVEAYPVDSRGDRIDRTLAYAGLRHWFTDAGFIVVAETSMHVQGHHRVVVRKELRPATHP